MLDSGAVCSLMDFGIVRSIGLDHSIKRTPNNMTNNLTEVSGNKLNIIGTVEVPLKICKSAPTIIHTFKVLDSNTNSTLLLGRDLMKKYGTVNFDFDSGFVRLGRYLIKGVNFRKRLRVKLHESVLIKGRSEQVISVCADSKYALMTADFEPSRLRNLHGLYSSRARVIPNIDGVFQITVLNVSDIDINLDSRKFMGFLHPTVNTNVVARVDQSPEQGATTIHSDDIHLGCQLSSKEKQDLQTLITKYDKVFASNPLKPPMNSLMKHRIITNDALPVKSKPRRLPLAWKSEIDRQVQEMVDNEIIRPSKSPWNCAVILVKKKDNSNRFVCDFRSLNDVTKKDSYPLPHIKDVIDQMEGARFWSTLDAASAYWSIPLAEEDKEKTAFSVPRGKFEFNRTPYGLTNAGATYQRMIDICLSGLPPDRVLAYMDDIVIFSKTYQEHLHTLETVFKRLLAAGITLKLSKCIFASNKVDFLGYELSEEGVKPQKRLTEAILTFATPLNRKELRRFLGLAGFYRRFIPQFASISRPLNRLTSDNVNFQWTDECDTAFNTLKQKLSSEPVLAFPKLGEPFVVEVDASDYAVGGVLAQLGNDNDLHPVAYMSIALNPSQQNWCPYSKEAYALLLATRD